MWDGTQVSIHSVLDVIASPVFVFQNDNILFANRAARVMLGQNSFQSWSDILSAESRLRFMQWLQNIDEPLEVQLVTAQRSSVWVSLTAVPVEFEDSPCLIGTMADITELKRAQSRLKVSEARGQLLAEHSPDIAATTDEKGTIIAISNTVDKMLGYSVSELLGLSSWTLIHPEDLAALKATARQLEQTHKDVQAEARLQHKQGGYRWFEMSLSIIFQDSNGSARNIVLARDINARKEAELRLREINRRYDELVTNIPDMVYRLRRDLDKHLCFDYVSPRCQALTGYTPQAILQNIWLLIDQILPEDRELFLKKLEGSAESLQPFYWWGRMQIDGKTRWRRLEARPAQTQDGTIIWDGIMLDISAQKKAETKLIDNEKQLRLITDNMRDIIIQIGSDAAIQYASPSVKAVAGYTQNELIGQSPFDNIHPDDVALVMDKFQGVMVEELAPYDIAFRYRHKEGHYIWLELNSTAIKDKDSAISGIVATARDITARKQAEEALRKRDEQLRLITAHSNDVISQVDNNGYIIYVSPSCQTILGYDPGELIGQPGFLHVHPDDITQVANSFMAAMGGDDKTDRRMQYRYRHKDGHFLWMETNASLVYDERGQPIGAVSSGRDITSRVLAEDSLRKNEERLRLITNHVNDIVTQVTPEGTFAYLSPSCLPILGYQPDELEGRPIFDHIHPDDLAELVEKYQVALASNKPAIAEYRFRHWDGHYVWLESSGGVLEGEDGQMLGIVVASRDVTERRRAGEALRLSEERYRRVSESISDYAFIMDVSEDGSISRSWVTEDSFTRITGYTAGESFTIRDGQAINVLLHPDHQEAFQRGIAQTLRGEDTQAEYKIITKTGEERWLLVSRHPIKDVTSGRVTGLYGGARDITDRKLAEEALRKNEEQLRLVTDNMQDMVSLSDSNFLLRYASASHLAILGYPPEALVGKNALQLIHPDDATMVAQKIQAAIEQHRPDSAEYRFRHADGYYTWLETSGQPLFDADGSFTGAVLSSRDVSERRRLQNSLMEQERLLITLEKEKELSILKTRMMSRLSHELRTPLAIISTSADLLETYFDRMTPEKRQERLQQILHQIKHFTDMLDNMSLVVKGVNYHPEHSPSPYDAGEVCREVIHEVQTTLKTNHDVQLNLNGASALVNADQQYLRLILTNLLSNAIKYSPSASPVMVDLTIENDVLGLRVTDRGIGIPEEDRPKLFETFFRGSNIGEVPGLGIGLSIVEMFVKANGGKVKVDSKLGMGTSVTIELPIKNT